MCEGEAAAAESQDPCSENWGSGRQRGTEFITSSLYWTTSSPMKASGGQWAELNKEVGPAGMAQLVEH